MGNKIKIHEIAKKLDLPNKKILEKAKELGIQAKTHLSSLEEEEAVKLEKAFTVEEKKANKK